MSEEEKAAAAAYVKLHENVEKLILDIVQAEIKVNFYGAFGGQLKTFIQTIINEEMRNFRVGRVGQTLPY
jgi:hypothetical protein